uniref:Uncharacterized protein n=1 Tax=Anguilla anguilla TaxID=7936 RepID=A0A0E9TWF4_ANGAN
MLQFSAEVLTIFAESEIVIMLSEERTVPRPLHKQLLFLLSERSLSLSSPLSQ